jgi:hypothetical protein
VANWTGKNFNWAHSIAIYIEKADFSVFLLFFSLPQTSGILLFLNKVLDFLWKSHQYRLKNVIAKFLYDIERNYR